MRLAPTLRIARHSLMTRRLTGGGDHVRRTGALPAEPAAAFFSTNFLLDERLLIRAATPPH